MGSWSVLVEPWALRGLSQRLPNCCAFLQPSMDELMERSRSRAVNRRGGV